MRAIDDAFEPRAFVEQLQSARLARMIGGILPHNRFYAAKLGKDAAGIRNVADLARLPFTTKAELHADQQAHPPYGTVLTYPELHYTRLHQTSGTHGTPLRWLDTPESWEAMLGCWLQI